MAGHDPQLIRVAGDITPEWLGTALGRSGPIEVLSAGRIGTGQMSQNYRVVFREGDGPEESVVAKLASADETSRKTGVQMRAYWREVSLYRELGARLEGIVPTCHLAVYDEGEGWFTLLLSDVRDGEQGDQIRGCDLTGARAAVATLAAMQARVLDDPAVGSLEFLSLPNLMSQQLLAGVLPGFLERYADRVSPEHAAVCRSFVPRLDSWAADRRAPLGLIHGDYRLDNILFSEQGCTVVDWQTVLWGPALHDLSYFIGSGLTPADRRRHEQELVRLFHDELLAGGVQALSWDECWTEYRRQAFHGLIMTIAASMLVERTDRGDDMFMIWFARAAQQILDLDSLDLVPA
jgi:hypothetical protein